MLKRILISSGYFLIFLWLGVALVRLGFIPFLGGIAFCTLGLFGAIDLYRKMPE